LYVTWAQPACIRVLKAHSETQSIRPAVWLRALVVMCVLTCTALPAAARDRTPVHINPYGDTVCGEPGEDPHLRLPVIVKVRDDGDVSTPADVNDSKIYPIESFGGECFGEDSRVPVVLDLVFRMLVDMLHR